MEGQLFLIEFLVDTVNIPAIWASQEKLLPTKTFVSFQVLGLPPVNIYQGTAGAEDCVCVNAEGPQVFKKGKSCLFALPRGVLQKPLTVFPVTMSVYKKLPPGHLPDVMLIGTHRIQICDLVNWVLSRQMVDNVNSYRMTKDTFQIVTATGRCAGEVTVFIRISSLGRKIVTQFQTLPENKKKLYLFKRIDSDSLFQFKKITPLGLSDKCMCKRTDVGSGEAATVISAAALRDEYKRKERRRRLVADDVRKDDCAPCCPENKSTLIRRKPAETGIRKCGCPVVQLRNS